MRASLTVAAVQPACAASDVAANAGSHAGAVRSSWSRLVVFPELSLTGYELHAPPVPLGEGLLDPITDACGETGSVALVGAPIEAEGARFIAMLRVDGAGVEVAYRKTWLGGAEPAGSPPVTGRQCSSSTAGVSGSASARTPEPRSTPQARPPSALTPTSPASCTGRRSCPSRKRGWW